MAYRVTSIFWDVQQPLKNNQRPHIYEVGGAYPQGYEVSAERYAELVKAGYIEKLPEPAKEAEPKKAATKRKPPKAAAEAADKPEA